MIQFNGKDVFRELFDRIQAAGHFAVIHNGAWHVSDESAVQAIVDAFSLDDARSPRIAQVKDLAKGKILAFLPDWKQSNYNARMNELNLIRFSRVWSVDEANEVAFLQTEWEKAKAIRAASNTHEANLNALTTFESVTAYDITASWPEV